MRTNFLLVSLAAMVAACSEQQPTSPAATTRAGVRPSADISAATNATAPAPQAKPVDQVGFTKVAVITSDFGSAAVGQTGGVDAVCPDGWLATGGGYQLYAGHPEVVTNRPVYSPPRAWNLSVDNSKGATNATFKAWVLCVS